jgi:hypothetical protein
MTRSSISRQVSCFRIARSSYAHALCYPFELTPSLLARRSERSFTSAAAHAQSEATESVFSEIPSAPPSARGPRTGGVPALKLPQSSTLVSTRSAAGTSRDRALAPRRHGELRADSYSEVASGRLEVKVAPPAPIAAPTPSAASAPAPPSLVGSSGTMDPRRLPTTPAHGAPGHRSTASNVSMFSAGQRLFQPFKPPAKPVIAAEDLCAVCEDSVATVQCDDDDCNGKIMCDECDSEWHRVSKYKNHKRHPRKTQPEAPAPPSPPQQEPTSTSPGPQQSASPVPPVPPLTRRQSKPAVVEANADRSSPTAAQAAEQTSPRASHRDTNARLSVSRRRTLDQDFAVPMRTLGLPAGLDHTPRPLSEDVVSPMPGPTPTQAAAASAGAAGAASPQQSPAERRASRRATMDTSVFFPPTMPTIVERRRDSDAGRERRGSGVQLQRRPSRDSNGHSPRRRGTHDSDHLHPERRSSLRVAQKDELGASPRSIISEPVKVSATMQSMLHSDGDAGTDRSERRRTNLTPRTRRSLGEGADESGGRNRIVPDNSDVPANLDLEFM